MKTVKLKDKVSNGVKANNSIVRVVIYAFVACFFGILFWNYATINKIRKNNIVIKENGTKVAYEIVNKESLLQSTISVHCKDAAYLINSFDRINLQANQAKALFLVERKSLIPIFEYFNKTGNYNQALKLGYTYVNEFQKVEALDLNQYPYPIIFTSITKIYNGGILEKEILVKSTGRISTIEANFKQSPQGYYLTDYRQEYSLINREEK